MRVSLFRRRLPLSLCRATDRISLATTIVSSFGNCCHVPVDKSRHLPITHREWRILVQPIFLFLDQSPEIIPLVP